MDQENVEYLKERLKYSGFDDQLNKSLEKEIKNGKQNFQLDHQMDIEGKRVDFKLHFNKSDSNDRYFFNKYDVKLFKEDQSLAPKEHTFYQNQGITAKQAFNLLEGRAVYKSLQNSDKEPYKAWIQLDLTEKDKNNNFKVNQYHEKYGFNINETLKNLPIKEINDETKAHWLIKSVEKGNQAPITMEKGGKEEIMFVEANPKFKSVNVYDIQMRTVKTNDLLQENKVDGLNGMDKKKDQSMKEGKTATQTPKTPKASKGKRV